MAASVSPVSPHVKHTDGGRTDEIKTLWLPCFVVALFMSGTDQQSEFKLVLPSRFITRLLY